MNRSIVHYVCCCTLAVSAALGWQPVVAAADAGGDADVARVAAAALAVEEGHAGRGGGIDDSVVLFVQQVEPEFQVRRITVSVEDGPTRSHSVSYLESEALRTGGRYRVAIAVPDGAALRVGVDARRDASVARTPTLRATARLDAPRAGATYAVRLEEAGLMGGVDLAVAPLDGPAALAAARIAYAGMLLDAGRPYDAARALIALDGPEAAPVRQAAQRALGIGTVSQAADPAAGASVAAMMRRAAERFADGRTDEGVGTLEAVVDAEPADPLVWTLQDQAHLVLAQHALASGQRDAAIAHFQAVRRRGLYTAQALLGLGWAHILPTGYAERAPARATDAGMPLAWRTEPLPLRVDDPAVQRELRRETGFRYFDAAAGTEGRRADLGRALRTWRELVGRDPLDPAVQEGMVAMGYGFGHLGARDRAMEAFDDAIVLLERARDQLLAARDHVESGALRDLVTAHEADDGGWPGWILERREARWWMNRDGRAPDTFYIEHLQADPAFRSAYRDHRVLRGIAGRMAVLAGASAGGDAARVGAEAESAARAAVHRLEDAALGDLGARIERVEAYLAEAHLALARYHDFGATEAPALPPEAAS
ncbi:hypothetical protein [Algiphilus sp.]|uniref:hypothetical protein n=1 Tax=Algiphilus sp. TaxID=1872431 RepID=UPI0025BF8F2C|nr:hypothetical protein [Algiphilus sp.]MCK5770999.1 hypothetical protein [Algiphilus sp.]